MHAPDPQLRNEHLLKLPATDEESLIYLAEIISRHCRVSDARRVSPRFPMSGLFGTCRVLSSDEVPGYVPTSDDPPPGQPMGALVFDLSFSGAGIQVSRFLRPGLPMTLEIGDAESRSLLSPCVVRWAEASDDSSFRAGLVFDWFGV